MKCRTKTFDSKTKFKNYLKKLKIMPMQFNRPTSEAHIKRMQDSVMNVGIQRGINVVVTDAFNGVMTPYIADSQHLTRGILNIKNADLFGHLIVFENHLDNQEDIINFVTRMNSTAKNWGLKNYLAAWCTYGLTDYKFLRAKHEETGYGISPLVEAYSNRRGFGNATFKQGKFVADKEVGNKIITLYETACELGLYKSNSSFLAFVRFYVDNTVDDAELLNSISRSGNLFSKKFSRDGYLALLRSHCK